MSGRPSVAAQTVTWGDFMMFKRLGILGVLAVCLFAIAIVMVGCGADEDDPPPPPPPPPPPVELTPMEKLAGTYSYVEGTRVVDDGVEVSPHSGQMHLRPGGNSWLITLELEDIEPEGYSGPTWTANATTITFIASDGTSEAWEYTLEGKFLTMTFVVEEGATLEKWRKD